MIPKVITEIKNILPSLTKEERADLKTSIQDYGQIEPILVGHIEGEGQFVLDGHNRLEILQEIGVDPIYSETPIVFDCWPEAKIWIIANQLGKRNLTDYAKAEIVLKKKPLIEELSQKRMLQGVKCQESNPRMNSSQGYQKGTTSEMLAEEIGISKQTLQKSENIAKNASEEVKEKLRAGDLSIHKADKEIKMKKIADREKTIARKAKNVKPDVGDYELHSRVDPSDAIHLFNEPIGAIIAQLTDSKGHFDRAIDVLGLGETILKGKNPLILLLDWEANHQSAQLIVEESPYFGFKLSASCIYIRYGKTISQDIWRFLLIFSKETLNPPRTIHYEQKKRGQVNAYGDPYDGFETMVKELTPSGEAILDPFCQTESIILASIQQQRKFIGIVSNEKLRELREESCRKASIRNKRKSIWREQNE